MKYVDELTLPEFDGWEGLQELRDRCSSLEGVVARVEPESSRISDLAGLLFLHNQVLQEQLKQERIRCRQFERDFEKMGREDFGRLVESFLTKGMFAKHAKRWPSGDEIFKGLRNGDQTVTRKAVLQKQQSPALSRPG
ncbi:hypothetical protein [Marinobacter sp. VGCF2001]|uniref:hypothetical protein n=1 Tax=Marinobacter sp. VGCF2001 TaxID=3417189 RepID=UPI003CF986B8